MDRLSNVVALLSAALIILVLGSLRRAHIRVEYSVSWLAAGVAMLVISQYPALRDRLAALIGVEDIPLAVLFMAFSIFLLVLYRFSVMISRLKDNNIALAQRVAILQCRLDSLYEERETPNQP